MRVTVSLLLSYLSLRPLYVLSASAQACSALAGSGCAAVQMTNAGLSQNSGFGAKRPVELPAFVPSVLRNPCKHRAEASVFLEAHARFLLMVAGHTESNMVPLLYSNNIPPVRLPQHT